MEQEHATQSETIIGVPETDAAFNVIAVDPIWLATNKEQMQKDSAGEDMSKVWGAQSVEIVCLSASGSPANSKNLSTSNNKIAVIRFSGAISKNGWAGTRELINILSYAAKEKDIAGVRLIVDSGGGQLSGVREVYELIRDYPKPLEAVVDGTLASAAYYMVAGADSILARQPTDTIGSIGILTTVRNNAKERERYGIVEYVQYASRSTSKNEEVRELIASSGKNATKLVEYLDVLNEQFIADVQEGRGDRLKTDKEDPFTGRTYFSKKAIEIGLIDGMLPSGDNFDSMEILIRTYYENQNQIPMASLKDKLMALLTDHKEDSKPENQEPETTASIEQLFEQISGLTTERDNAVASLTTAQCTIASLTAERDQWKAKADAFGSQPGATPTTVAKEKDETPTEGTEAKTLAEILAELPSEKMAAELGFE